MRVGPRRATLASALAGACLLLAACGGGSAAGKAGNAVAGGALAIPPGSSAAAQLKALKGCQPTPAPQGQEHWLVNAGSPNPTYALPTLTPKIGKSLASWPKQPMVVLGDCTDTETWTFAAADSKNLYLAVQVDSTLPVVQGTHASPWTGDVVQFAVDASDAKNNGSYSSGDYEMGFLLASDGSPFLYMNVQSGSGITPVAIQGGQVTITRSNGITLYEGAIPWSAMGGSVSSPFGFNVAIGAGGPPYQQPNWGYEWTQGLIESKNPADFAQLTHK